jgi:hypothetical protein
MAANDAETVEYQTPRRRITDRAPNAGTGPIWRRLITIGEDDDVAIRWWPANGSGRRGPRRRR